MKRLLTGTKRLISFRKAVDKFPIPLQINKRLTAFNIQMTGDSLPRHEDSRLQTIDRDYVSPVDC